VTEGVSKDESGHSEDDELPCVTESKCKSKGGYIWQVVPGAAVTSHILSSRSQSYLRDRVICALAAKTLENCNE